MKALRYLPLVYIVGVDGFVFFAPYILLLLTLAYVYRIYRARQLHPQLVPVRSGPFFRYAGRRLG
jgi:hypothetical protein